MAARQFDGWMRSLGDGASRRNLLRGIAAAVGLGALSHPGEGEAGKRKRGKKRPALAFNAFGCVNVGGACRGKDANCCSGICQGKKPKPGKRDASRCVAHDEGSCQPDQDACLASAPPCAAGGNCYRTTGEAVFCAAGEALCEACRNDIECEALGFGPGAACIVCPGLCPDSDTYCESAAT